VNDLPSGALLLASGTVYQNKLVIFCIFEAGIILEMPAGSATNKDPMNTGHGCTPHLSASSIREENTHPGRYTL